MFLWIDLETTGLKPEADMILEIAWVLTDADLNREYMSGSALIKEPTRFPVDPVVDNMHRNSGLWQDLNDANHDGRTEKVEAVDARLLGMLKVCTTPDDRIILAGSTPHFDRGFIHRWMPGLDNRLHYRHFDVSTIKMLADSVGLNGSFMDPPEPVHRAADDIAHSLDVARYFQNLWRLKEGLSVQR